MVLTIELVKELIKKTEFGTRKNGSGDTRLNMEVRNWHRTSTTKLSDNNP